MSTIRAVLVASIAIALSFMATSPAAASVFPIGEVEGHWFPVESDHVQLISALIDLQQESALAGGTEWALDIELVVRSNRGIDAVVPLAVVVDPPFAAELQVFVRGVPAALRDLDLRHDPALPDHVYRSVGRLDIDFAPMEEVTVRVVGRVLGTIDSLGRVFVELPTHALGLFADDVSSGRIAIDWVQRPLALQATITNGTTYDEPEMRTTWLLRDWAPAIPFRASTLPPWSALLLVTAVEQCPDPWRVVRDMADGNIASLRAQLQPLDEPTREFCGELPGILHGRPFESDQVRAQLGEMTLGRYMGNQDDSPVYQPNPVFDEGALSEAEAIYTRALQMLW